jgi:hypothetical protein
MAARLALLGFADGGVSFRKSHASFGQLLRMAP